MAADVLGCTRGSGPNGFVRVQTHCMRLCLRLLLGLAVVMGEKDDATMAKVKQNTRDGTTGKVGLVCEEQLRDSTFQ